jgi:hypothetical protein
VARAARAAGGALEDPQLVHVRVAQRPQPIRGGEDEVDRVQRQLGGHPAGRRDDARGDVTAVAVGLAGHQREEPLGVGVALHERPGVAQLLLEALEVVDHPVVREEPPALLERMGVASLDRARRRVADVGDERRGVQLARLARERLVLVGRERLLGHMRTTVGVEPPDARAVGLAAALLSEAVGRLEQPERRPHAPLAAAHAEEPTHARHGAIVSPW